MTRRGAIGLTGGIACGKSAVAGFLLEMGVPVLDTDAVTHMMLEPGHWVYERVVQAFGSGYVRAEGGIDRRRLGALVFADEGARSLLNGIMHPEIFAEAERWLDEQLAREEHAVVMVPLLYETGAEKRFEKVVVVASGEAAVAARLAARGLTPEQAAQRIAAQLPVADKVARADAVIWNNADLEHLRAETRRVWNECILGKET